MQVKKFEAKTMKDALEMVKNTMGPEAIILSARDIKSGFGLSGGTSVEVTAAASAEMLKKKAIAEQRLSENVRDRYLSSSATRQKAFINKVIEAETKKNQPAREITRTPYIDILEDSIVPPSKETDRIGVEIFGAGVPPIVPRQPADTEMALAQATRASEYATGAPSVNTAEARIKGAVQRAFSDAHGLFDEPEAPARPQQPIRRQRVAGPSESVEIHALRREIKRLNSLVKQFQAMPQTFTSLHPGAEEGIPFELSFMYEKLLRSGIGQSHVIEALHLAQEKLPREQIKKKAFVNAWVAKYILDRTRIADNRTLNRYHVFVGPPGQGKTSSLVKLASHMVICEKKSVAIVTTDTSRIGSHEQLKIYAQILNVPFAVVRKKQDWQLLESKLSKVDCILVDFPGLNLKSIAETDFIRNILPPNLGGRSIHYVQSALAKDYTAFEVASRYQMIGVNDVIFTNLDETTHHGSIFNFQERFHVPLHSFGIGPNIPEDIEPATKERVVDLIFKITKLRKNEAIDE